MRFVFAVSPRRPVRALILSAAMLLSVPAAVLPTTSALAWHPHHHEQSMYGNLKGYKAAMDRNSPEYQSIVSTCQTEASMGAFPNTIISQSPNMGRRKRQEQLYGQCMTSHGAWHQTNLNNNGLVRDQ